MGILINLVLGFVHLVLLALDIICFFVIIRMLCHKINRPWLNTFDSVGGSLVDLYVSYLQKAINRISSKTFSQAAWLNIAMLTLVIARIFLVALFSK
jgi:hypothetical protein